MPDDKKIKAIEDQIKIKIEKISYKIDVIQSLIDEAKKIENETTRNQRLSELNKVKQQYLSVLDTYKTKQVLLKIEVVERSIVKAKKIENETARNQKLTELNQAKQQYFSELDESYLKNNSEIIERGNNLLDKAKSNVSVIQRKRIELKRTIDPRKTGFSLKDFQQRDKMLEFYKRKAISQSLPKTFDAAIKHGAWLQGYMDYNDTLNEIDETIKLNQESYNSANEIQKSTAETTKSKCLEIDGYIDKLNNHIDVESVSTGEVDKYNQVNKLDAIQERLNSLADVDNISSYDQSKYRKSSHYASIEIENADFKTSIDDVEKMEAHIEETTAKITELNDEIKSLDESIKELDQKILKNKKTIENGNPITKRTASIKLSMNQMHLKSKLSKQVNFLQQKNTLIEGVKGELQQVSTNIKTAAKQVDTLCELKKASSLSALDDVHNTFFEKIHEVDVVVDNTTRTWKRSALDIASGQPEKAREAFRTAEDGAKDPYNSNARCGEGMVDEIDARIDELEKIKYARRPENATVEWDTMKAQASKAYDSLKDIRADVQRLNSGIQLDKDFMELTKRRVENVALFDNTKIEKFKVYTVELTHGMNVLADSGRTVYEGYEFGFDELDDVEIKQKKIPEDVQQKFERIVEKGSIVQPEDLSDSRVLSEKLQEIQKQNQATNSSIEEIDKLIKDINKDPKKHKGNPQTIDKLKQDMRFVAQKIYNTEVKIKQTFSKVIIADDIGNNQIEYRESPFGGDKSAPKPEGFKIVRLSDIEKLWMGWNEDYTKLKDKYSRLELKLQEVVPEVLSELADEPTIHDYLYQKQQAAYKIK